MDVSIPYSAKLLHHALGFFKISRKTFGKICICLLRVHFEKRAANDLFDDVYAIFFLNFFIKAIMLYSFERC